MVVGTEPHPKEGIRAFKQPTTLPGSLLITTPSPLPSPNPPLRHTFMRTLTLGDDALEKDDVGVVGLDPPSMQTTHDNYEQVYPARLPPPSPLPIPLSATPS